MLILIDTVDTYDTSDIFFRIHKKDVVAVLFFLFSLTIQERLMENLGYTGPHEFRKHTLTAR